MSKEIIEYLKTLEEINKLLSELGSDVDEKILISLKNILKDDFK